MKPKTFIWTLVTAFALICLGAEQNAFCRGAAFGAEPPSAAAQQEGPYSDGNPEWVFTGMAALKERGFTDYEPFAPEKWPHCKVLLSEDGAVLSINAPRWRVAAAIVSVLKLTPENRLGSLLEDNDGSRYLARFVLEYRCELESLTGSEFTLWRVTPGVSHLLVRALGRAGTVNFVLREDTNGH